MTAEKDQPPKTPSPPPPRVPPLDRNGHSAPVTHKTLEKLPKKA